MSYEDFLGDKLHRAQPSGFEPSPKYAKLFPFQIELVKWALRRGRAALFASTGLGKTRMQLEWAYQVAAHTSGKVLILAPLAVAAQTQKEGEELGIGVSLAREQSDCEGAISVTNYERLHKFDPSAFTGVVLDESSVIKHFNSKTLGVMLDAFGRHKYKLCATATPSPNDYTELGTHAEFLGVCTRMEMLSEFFTHDGGETQLWRLKGHARKEFWKWVSSWGALVRMPSDLGHSDDGYQLPDLKSIQHTIKAENIQVFASGQLFPADSMSLSERRGARRQSMSERVRLCAEMVNGDSEQWLVWCGLNDESKSLVEAIPGAVEVCGSDDIDDKEERLVGFANTKYRVLVTKPSIAGWGLNLQSCARMAFVGVSDSWEEYHQAVRRCWRFGQKRQVEVHVFTSEMEGAVVRNLERKALDAERMAVELSAETAAAVKEEVQESHRLKHSASTVHKINPPSWLVSRGI